jgi:hypothetical protein
MNTGIAMRIGTFVLLAFIVSRGDGVETSMADSFCADMHNFKVYVDGKPNHYGHAGTTQFWTPPGWVHKKKGTFEVKNFHSHFTKDTWVPNLNHDYCGSS